ncbi:MarR family transcriptional regulator [Actinomadura sp. NBRC 104412]|nr:MarR family transcriptional regulator [Actinomadura sp. NBRC 104412]
MLTGEADLMTRAHTTPQATTAGTAFTTALIRLTQHVEQVFGEVGRERGLTPQQAHVLCHLVDGPIGMADLSRRLHLEKSSVTGLVDRVERRGLVARVRDDRDRRAYRVALTDEGSRLACETHEAVNQRLERLAADLAPAERDGLVATILRALPPPP